MWWQVALAPRHRRKSPRALLLPACVFPRPLPVNSVLLSQSSPNKKRRLGVADALRMVANELSMFVWACVARAYAGHLRCPVSIFCWELLTDARDGLPAGEEGSGRFSTVPRSEGDPPDTDASLLDQTGRDT